MIKNKTLKSLAISAVVALGLSGFASAPASANYGLADKTFVTVAPASGDEFTVLADSQFMVEANKAALTGELSLLVEDSGSVVTNSAGVARAANNSFVLGNAATDTSTSASSQWLLTQADTARNAFSASKTIQVTAWNDANNNGKIDATEYASTTQTITFLDADAVTLNVSLNRPFVGQTTLSALVSTTPTLNDEQVTSASFSAIAQIVFQKSGIATTASATAGSFVWDEDDRNYTVTSPAFNTWGFVSMSATVADASVSRTVLTSVRVTTGAVHNARVGDGFKISSSAHAGRATVSSIVSTTVFVATTTTGSPAATFSTAVNATLSNVVHAVSAATAGTYVAVGNWNGVKVATSEFATSAVVADSVEVTIAGSANTDAVVDSSSATARVKTGTLTVDVIATVLDEDGDPVAAGKVVLIKNDYTSGKDIKVNGKTGTDTVLTDAKGQVKATVTTVAGATGLTSTLTFDAEGAATAAAALTWTAQAFSMVDLSVANGTFEDQTRSILKGGSYALDLAVVDQWYTAPADSSIFRVTVTGAGAANGIVNLTGGKAAVTIGDNGLATSYATTITLQRQNAAGTWAAVSGASAVVTTAVATGAVTLGANATALFGATVVLASDVAAKALVEGDIRVAPLAVPAYANNAVVAGAVRNATTGVAVNGAVVTITGPTSLLFSNGVAYKRGSITVLADSSGHFNVNVFSTTAGKDIVVTAASMGNSSTTKLTFTGIGVGEGTSFVITAPDTVAPASTLQIKAKLTDAFGNGVEATEGRVKMTYTGPGIGFGTLPTKTDATGELSYSVLLGAGDTGTITVVVSYDQNGDGDFVDAKDLNTTKTITVGTAAAVPASDQKLTVGSFKGFVAIYALNYTGQKLSAKVAGKWLVENDLARFERVVRNTGAAIPVIVELYIDGKLVRTENIVTK